MNFRRYVVAALAVFVLFPLTGYPQEIMASRYRKVLAIGAHPDDSEYMCAGTMMKLRDQGCEVVSVYFTRGEAGIKGKTHEEARKIREQECLDACRIMGVRPVFLTQVDGSSEVNRERYDEMWELIEREKPDMVITHWPIDRHRDHKTCAILVYDAWRRANCGFDLYYTEVTTGYNTSNFNPTTYVDITAYHDRKFEAIRAHASQRSEKYETAETLMEEFRGLEYHCKYAEAFVKQVWTGE